MYEHSEEFEKLSRAIIKAISSSKEVKTIILNLKENNISLDKSLLAFMLDLKSILTLTQDKPFEPEAESKPRATIRKGNVIDGRKMTKEEAEYYRYCATNFDENDWLKKNRLSMDDSNFSEY
jgi:hypothetical protein